MTATNDKVLEFRWPPLEKWAELLLRAQQEGIVLRYVSRSRTVMHVSSSDGTDAAYIIGELGCSCPAGKHGVFCKHFCLYLYQHMDRLIKKYGPPSWWIEASKEELTA